MNSAESKLQETRTTAIDKRLFDANRFSQWLKLRAVGIKLINPQNKTRTRDQQIIDAENFFSVYLSNNRSMSMLLSNTLQANSKKVG